MKPLIVKLAAKEAYQRANNGYALVCDALAGVESAQEGNEKGLVAAKEQLHKGLDELKIAIEWLTALKE